jgi:hypothetical protein
MFQAALTVYARDLETPDVPATFVLVPSGVRASASYWSAAVAALE